MQQHWTLTDALTLYHQSFSDLLFQAQTIHRQHFAPNEIQISTLLSIKTGKCPENCSYCPQSAHFDTKLQSSALMDIEEVIKAATLAKSMGATRFCMGAAWRGPNDKDLAVVNEMVKEVKKLGLETCVTLGLLKDGQAETLKSSGLDFYNHNIDTSESHYSNIISTRTFQQRIDTLKKVQSAGLKVCCGGILGIGETLEDRVEMLITLANLSPAPESLPINQLIRVPGTPLANEKSVDPIDFVKTIALARILMPKTVIRLSAGRENMDDSTQALCFLAGANSIFYGEKLLTTENPYPEKDDNLFQRLGLRKQALEGA